MLVVLASCASHRKLTKVSIGGCETEDSDSTEYELIILDPEDRKSVV